MQSLLNEAFFMAERTVQIKTISKIPYKIVGINSNLKDFQLSLLINETFKLDLRYKHFDSINMDCFSDDSKPSKSILIQVNDPNHLPHFAKLKSFDFIWIDQLLLDHESEISLNGKANILYANWVDPQVLSKKEEGLFKRLLQ